MQPKKVTHSTLHPRNVHQGRYDLRTLAKLVPALSSYIFVNEHGNETLPFEQPEAVKLLNEALLKKHYGLQWWNLPDGYLCPPVPGRADYVHHAADLLVSTAKDGHIPTGNTVTCVDIGTGANCIYPIIAHQVYGWKCIGTETDPVAVGAARLIVEKNPSLHKHVEIRKQARKDYFLRGILHTGEYVHIVLCNPPFYASVKEAEQHNARKNKGLHGKKAATGRNFGGQAHELWYKGGEVAFVSQLMEESRYFAQRCHWFSCLIAKKSSLTALEKKIRRIRPSMYVIVPMGQGNKVSRMIAWTFR